MRFAYNPQTANVHTGHTAAHSVCALVCILGILGDLDMGSAGRSAVGIVAML